MKKDVVDMIKQEKLIAIVRGVSPELCMDVAQALYAGGFRLMEITFDQKKPDSWEATANAIRAVGNEYAGRMEIGAGTVVSEKLVELAADAGAKYIISPDTNVDVIKRTIKRGLVSIPGALTPTEIMTAYSAGADFVKLFPLADLGPAYVKAVRAPISHVPMMAVGGIHEKNLKMYLDLGLSGAGIGGNLVNSQWIKAKEFYKITEAAKVLTDIVKN